MHQQNKLRAGASAHLHVLGGLGFEKDGEPGKAYTAHQEVGGEGGRGDKDKLYYSLTNTLND